MASYSKELLKGAADTLVLSTFVQGELHGYHVLKELERRSEGFFRFKEGTLYPILHRLEKQGLLAARWETMPSGSERRYYSLTTKGRNVLEEKLSEWQSFVSAMSRVTGTLGLEAS
jgi:PadR family transcriptional regulator PadR